MTQESMIGYNGDSDDDLCNSSPELSEQVHNTIINLSISIFFKKSLKFNSQKFAEIFAAVL